MPTPRQWQIVIFVALVLISSFSILHRAASTNTNVGVPHVQHDPKISALKALHASELASLHRAMERRIPQYQLNVVKERHAKYVTSLRQQHERDLEALRRNATASIAKAASQPAAPQPAAPQSAAPQPCAPQTAAPQPCAPQPQGPSGYSSTDVVRVVRLHDAMHDLFWAFDDVCTKHNISYWLHAGTCVGATRNGGHLIPWDHDIDIGILAKDLVRLMAAEPQFSEELLSRRIIFSHPLSKAQGGGHSHGAASLPVRYKFRHLDSCYDSHNTDGRFSGLRNGQWLIDSLMIDLWLYDCVGDEAWEKAGYPISALFGCAPRPEPERHVPGMFLGRHVKVDAQCNSLGRDLDASKLPSQATIDRELDFMTRQADVKPCALSLDKAPQLYQSYREWSPFSSTVKHKKSG